MKIWMCNWASVQDAECLHDDVREIDAEFLANPTGILLASIDDIEKVRQCIVADQIDLYGNDATDEPLVLREERLDYREYAYGDDTVLICVAKEVM